MFKSQTKKSGIYRKLLSIFWDKVGYQLPRRLEISSSQVTPEKDSIRRVALRKDFFLKTFKKHLEMVQTLKKYVHI